MIPKIIHYCWFGKKPKDYMAKACIASFNIIGVGKIIEWNEDNCTVDENGYVQAAYKANSYAHVSDYYRLKRLYEYGGIYLDTDVQIKKPLLESFFNADLVLGYMYECAISTAFIMAKPKHPYIKGLLDLYEGMTFDSKKPNNAVFNDFTIEHYPNFRLNGKTREFIPNGFIYPRYYFEVPTFKKEGGYSVHHFMGSWHGSKKSIKGYLRKPFKWLRFHCNLIDWWYQNYIRNKLLHRSGYFKNYQEDLKRD